MRIILALPLLLLAGCNVSKEGNAVTVQYDQNTAENAAADVANTAEDIASDIGNGVENTANKVENRTDDNRDSNASENRQ